MCQDAVHSCPPAALCVRPGSPKPLRPVPMRKPFRALLVILSLAALAGLSGCGGGGGSSGSPAPYEIFVSPTSATVTVNGIRQFTAEARNSAGQVVGGVQFAWSTSDSRIAESLGNGRFKGIAVGAVQVTA